MAMQFCVLVLSDFILMPNLSLGDKKMKKYAFLLANLVLFTVSACTGTVSENVKSALPLANSSEKPKNADTKLDAKPTSGNAVGWQDYSSLTGKYSVQMPNKPKEKSDSKTSMVIAESNTSAYLVSYTVLPNKIPDVAVPEMLNGAVKVLVSSIQGELKSTKPVKLGEFSCLDFDAKGKIQTTDAIAKGRICVADEYYYQVFTLGPTTKFSDPDYDRFVKSFKINK